MDSYSQYLSNVQNVDAFNDYYEGIQRQKDEGSSTAEETAGLLIGKQAMGEITKPLIKAGLQKLGVGEDAAEKIASGNISEGVSEEVTSRLSSVVEDVNTRINPIVQQVREAVIPEQVGDIELSNLSSLGQQISPLVEGAQYIRQGDTMADVINDSNKFTEFVQRTDDQTKDYLFTSTNRDMTSPTDIEEVRTGLKGMLDNPLNEDQEYLAQGFRENVLYPRQEAIQAEQQEFISPEITGGLRGDTTIARALQMRQQPTETTAETTTAETTTAEATTAEATTGEVVGEIAGETAAETGLETAGAAVESIPILGQILGPILQVAGAGLALGLAARNKHKEIMPVINQSYQML